MFLGALKMVAQSIVIDPTLVGTLVYAHTEQQNVLNKIKDEEGRIRNFQILIQQKMGQIKDLQEKTYNYLSTVNAVVKNGKDIIYASNIAKDIYEQLNLSTDPTEVKLDSLKWAEIPTGIITEKSKIKPVFLRLDSEIAGASKKGN